MKIKKADFIKSAVYEKDYPEQLDKMEFAFVGRSNVGKSSLINSLTSRLKLEIGRASCRERVCLYV